MFNAAMKVIYFCTLLIFISCIKRFTPVFKESDSYTLVVEGNMDPGGDSTFVRLTRTLNINDTATLRAEAKAQVVIEGKDNIRRTLIEKGKGYYVFPGLNLTIGNEYRLRIKTTAGEEYLSDYVRAKRSPAIDSLTWKVDTMGLHYYVHTHDPDNATRYYRWDCVEAWQIRMPLYAEVMYSNGIVRQALWPQDNMWECFSYDSTESLITANTRTLSSDVISYKEVRTIPYHDPKIEWEYAILVKQYAIDEAGYKFYSFLKNHSEGIGNIFSPQPFALQGNIRSTQDTTRYAVGNITASTVSKISRHVTSPELIYWRPSYSMECRDSVKNVGLTITDFRYYFDQLGFMPFQEIRDMSGRLLGYKAARPECVNCRVLGATPARPYFW
jgi:hypothetical protein